MMPSAIAATPERSIWNVALAPSRPPAGRSSVSPMQAVACRRARRRGTARRWARSACPSCAAAWTARGRACRGRARTDSILRSAGRVALVELADEHDRVGVRAVGDERLRAVEDVLVAVAAGGATSSSRRRREPEPGSVIAQAPILSMVSRSSAQRSFWAMVPFDMIAAAGEAHADTPIAVTMPGQHPAQLDDRDQRQAAVAAAVASRRPAAASPRRRRRPPPSRVRSASGSGRGPWRPCRRSRTACAGCRTAAGRRAPARRRRAVRGHRRSPNRGIGFFHAMRRCVAVHPLRRAAQPRARRPPPWSLLVLVAVASSGWSWHSGASTGATCARRLTG